MNGSSQATIAMAKNFMSTEAALHEYERLLRSARNRFARNCRDRGSHPNFLANATTSSP
jgi:hypothetical protein